MAPTLPVGYHHATTLSRGLVTHPTRIGWKFGLMSPAQGMMSWLLLMQQLGFWQTQGLSPPK